MTASLRLPDAVRLVVEGLEPGETTTARKVARTVGDDQARVLALLRELVAAGRLRSRRHRSTRRPHERPYELFFKPKESRSE